MSLTDIDPILNKNIWFEEMYVSASHFVFLGYVVLCLT